MNNLKDDLKYPFTAAAREIEKYIKRGCPCVCFFNYKSDLTSTKILQNIITICEEFPNVFCYKIGWASYLTYPSKNISHNPYEVSVWRSGIKEIYFDNPTFAQLKFMFQYVNDRISGVDKQNYISSLEKEKHYHTIYEKQKKRRFMRKKDDNIKTQNYFNPHLKNFLDSSIILNDNVSDIKNKPIIENTYNKLQIFKEISITQTFPINLSKKNQNEPLFSNHLLLKNTELKINKEESFHKRDKYNDICIFKPKDILNKNSDHIFCPIQIHSKQIQMKKNTLKRLSDISTCQLEIMSNSLVQTSYKAETPMQSKVGSQNLSISGASKRKTKHPRKYNNIYRQVQK